MRAVIQKYAWLCPLASVVLAIAFLVAFGLTWWNALMVGALLGCPLSVLWSLVFGRREPPARMI
jgi:hypothetical protein